MKKTLNINLGGMAFVIDESAFTLLHNYLEALKRKFNNEQEREEIMNDIEARIAEMLSEKLGTRKEVLSEQDVEYVIGLMGKPEDIAGDEPAAESTNAGAEQSSTTSGTYTAAQGSVKKRLFRDPDDSKIGGVISGLCHYFGIDDPTWLRIAALVLIPITSGSIMLLYIILLIVVPKALTSAEKLQMKGEPVTINNIKKEVQDAAGRFTDTVTGLNSEGFFNKLGSIVVELAKAFGKVVAVFMVLFGFGGLIVVLISFGMFLLFGTLPFAGLANLLVNSSSTITLFSVGFLLFCAAPLIGIIYAAFKVMLGSTARVRWLKWALLGMWFTGLILLLFTGYETAINFKDSATTKDDYVLMQPTGNTLYVQLADSTVNGWVDVKAGGDNDEDDEENSFNVVINGRNLKDMDRYKIGEPGLQLTTSDNDSFYISKIVTARGSNRGNAIKNAQLVMYSFSQTDSVLKLSDKIELAKNQGKWRAQNVKIRIAVPKGKLIKFAGNVDEISAIVKGDNSYDDTYFANTTWTNEDGKIKCLTCTGSNVSNVDEEDTDTDNTDTVSVTDKVQQKVDEKVKKLEQKVDELNKKVEKSTSGKDQSHEDF